MSADLFAAFGAQSLDDDNANITKEFPGPQVQNGPIPIEQKSAIAQDDHGSAEEEDDFGDFEGDDPTRDHSEDTLDWTNQFEAQHGTSLQEPGKTEAKTKTNQTKDPDVLFDAEDSVSEGDDEGFDDDFGDFEDPGPRPAQSQPPAKASQARPIVSPEDDLLGSFVTPGKPQQKSGPADASKPATPKARPAPKKKAPIPTPVVRTSTIDSNDTWDDFNTTDAPEITSTPNTSTSLPTSILDSMTVATPSPPPLCPSNIPPPSVLLPLFPPILSEISTSILQPFLALPSTSRTPSPQLRTFLTSHQHLLQVLAHIIAGRKHRWRRDKRLAAATRIGPGGGLKLAGLDKSEPAREDAQVDEVLRAVKIHVGPLRAVVGAVNSAGGGGAIGAVPDLAGVMPVRTATSAEGAVVGTIACGLCGLKREERVAKFDVEVLDSFGEWWVEKTNMHLGCWRFWEGFKHRLGQR